MTGQQLYLEYARINGLPEDTSEMEIGPFGDSPEMAQELLSLIQSGRKRATCWACLHEEAPEPGGISVITDWAGNAGCVLQTVKAEVLPFSAVTWEMARLEGEDECFASWRAGHTRFFTEEAQREGYVFSENMPVIFERFRVVWPREYADEA